VGHTAASIKGPYLEPEVIHLLLDLIAQDISSRPHLLSLLGRYNIFEDVFTNLVYLIFVNVDCTVFWNECAHCGCVFYWIWRITTFSCKWIIIR
jgi:hypothetical protein